MMPRVHSLAVGVPSTLTFSRYPCTQQAIDPSMAPPSHGSQLTHVHEVSVVLLLNVCGEGGVGSRQLPSAVKHLARTVGLDGTCVVVVV